MGEGEGVTKAGDWTASRDAIRALTYADEIFDEAENRLHTIKAVLVATLGD